MSQQSASIAFRYYTLSDYATLKAVMESSFGDIEACFASEEEMRLQSEMYPSGQILCMVNGQVIGAVISRVVPYSVFGKAHTLKQAEDVNRYRQDALEGDCVYGLDVFVKPGYQNLRVGKQLVQQLCEQIRKDNYKGMVGVSRLVGYHAVKDQMSCAEYAQKVVDREMSDPVFNFHLSNGFKYIDLSDGFDPRDHNSCGYGANIFWTNPDYIQMPKLANSNLMPPLGDSIRKPKLF